MKIKVGDIVCYHDRDEHPSVHWYAKVIKITGQSDQFLDIRGLTFQKAHTIGREQVTTVYSSDASQ